MTVQPIVAEMLPGGQGYRVRFLEPWVTFPPTTRWPTPPPSTAGSKTRSSATRRSICGCTALQDAPAGRARPVLSRWPCAGIDDDNRPMKLRFTKMQGAGNDFVVLDATRTPLNLSAEQCAASAIAASASVPTRSWWSRAATHPGRRFRLPHLQQQRRRGRALRQWRALLRALCARQGLSDKTTLRVETVNNLLELHLQPDGRVTVDMNAPVFDLPRVPFHAAGLRPHRVKVKGGDRKAPHSTVAAGHQGARCRGGGAVDGQPACGAVGRRCRHRTGRSARAR
jgi:hypothetical protein